jgi:hypothetical protein
VERLDSQSFSSVRERDIDLLLLEELTVSPAFRTWFLRQISPSTEEVDGFVDAWHSVTDSELGESDIEFGVVHSDGTQTLVMIENKVDATFQEAQLERYEKRGEKATTEEWDSYVTGLFAPEAYLAGTNKTGVVVGTVSYEAARDWFREQETARAGFKAEMLTEAIEQGRRGYTPEIDEDVSALHQHYWELSHERFPELGMDRPDGVPSGNLWVRFDPSGLPSEVQLIHKMGRGDVDLQFSGAASEIDSFQRRYSPLLEEGMEIVPTGKSVSIRINVPSMSAERDPADQRDRTESGLRAAHRLLSWYEKVDHGR